MHTRRLVGIAKPHLDTLVGTLGEERAAVVDSNVPWGALAVQLARRYTYSIPVLGVDLRGSQILNRLVAPTYYPHTFDWPT